MGNLKLGNMPEDYPHYNESFRDIAKLCLKKKNKGPFDQVVSSLYRYHKLIEYLKESNTPNHGKEILLEILTKGLHYNSFEEFKEEKISSEVFSFLAEQNNMKDFYEYLSKDSQDIKKTFLQLVQSNLKEYEEEIIFMKNMLNNQIEEKENLLK
jgi:hypothetical protein